MTDDAASPAGNRERRLVVAGTDTDVGKTVFAAALAGALGAQYWKPVQAGSDPATDTATAIRLGVPLDRAIPEAYRLRTAVAPHLSAEIDGLAIDSRTLAPPDIAPLVIETAGGLLVPLTRELLQIDLLARWGLPVVLVARTSLGTINHSLLSLEALRARAIPVLGIAFVGDANADSERAICEHGRVRRLGRLPHVAPLDAASLAAAFAANFRLEDFQ